MPAQSAPNEIPTTIATSMWIGHGMSRAKPTQPAPTAAMSICPWPPMLNSPARNASATPRPAAMSGVAKFREFSAGRIAMANESARKSHTAPRNRAAYAFPTAAPSAEKVSPGRLKK